MARDFMPAKLKIGGHWYQLVGWRRIKAEANETARRHREVYTSARVVRRLIGGATRYYIYIR